MQNNELHLNKIQELDLKLIENLKPFKMVENLSSRNFGSAPFVLSAFSAIFPVEDFLYVIGQERM